MPDDVKIHDIKKDGKLDGQRYVEVSPGKFALWPEGADPPKASKSKSKSKEAAEG